MPYDVHFAWHYPNLHVSRDLEERTYKVWPEMKMSNHGRQGSLASYTRNHTACIDIDFCYCRMITSISVVEELAEYH